MKLLPVPIDALKKRARWASLGAPRYLMRDAEQEAWIGIMQALERYDGRIRFDSWAARRANGAVIDFLRREDILSRNDRKRVQRGEADAPARVTIDECWMRPTPADQEEKTLCAELWRAVDTLPPAQRLLIEIMLTRGLSAPAAGKLLKIGHQAAWRRYYHALHTLQERFVPEKKAA